MGHGQIRIAMAHPNSCLLRVAVGEQFLRALEAGEEDRDLLTLAFQGGLGGEDFLGQELQYGCFRRQTFPWLTVKN